jgi:hypothetical protein
MAPHDSTTPCGVPVWSDDDPYTMSGSLCDDDGIVRGGAMHHGTDYPCTGHAHFAGHHIRCESPAHPGNPPRDLLDALSRSVEDRWPELFR